MGIGQVQGGTRPPPDHPEGGRRGGLNSGFSYIRIEQAITSLPMATHANGQKPHALPPRRRFEASDHLPVVAEGAKRLQACRRLLAEPRVTQEPSVGVSVARWHRLPPRGVEIA